MFEDISDPSRRWPPQGKDALPIDSDEASQAMRLWAGVAFAIVALNVMGWITGFPKLFLRDEAFLVLVALVWILRSRAAAVLASAMVPLFLFGDWTAVRHEISRHPGSGRASVLLIAATLFSAWSCFRFHQFRKAEEAALPPDSPDAVRPA